VFMSGIFDILPLILTGVSLLLGEGLDNKKKGDRERPGGLAEQATAKAGESILKECEKLIKSLSPYQRLLLQIQLEAADRRSRCLDTAITEKRVRDY